MQVVESIKSAWAAVEESGVPKHMEDIAFREALRALLGTNVPAGTVNAKKATAKTPGDGAATKVEGKNSDEGAGEWLDEDTVIASVSAETGVPVEKLERVFHIDGGVVKLLGVHTKYGPNTADKARSIAQLVTVVRRVGMQKNDTPLTVIKAACDSKHAYDGKNFTSKHMTSVSGCVIKGEGQNRRLEAKNVAITAFPALIDQILGES